MSNRILNTMKKNITLVVATMLLWTVYGVVACGSSSKGKEKDEKPVCDEWIHPDSTAYENLGRRLTDVLINAKTINAYSLVAKEKVNPDDYEVLPSFVREASLGKLTKDQATVLKYMLVSNGANYYNDSSFIVMSPFYPVIEFEFAKQKETAHIVVSFSDYTWAVKYDDKIQFKYNYASGIFLKRFCGYFLNQNK